MPVIPQMENQRVYPLSPMSPGVVGQAGETVERSGRQMERLGEYGGQVANAIQREQDRQIEIDQKAEEANKALKIGMGIKNDTDVLAENWNGRSDYENFINDVDEWEKNTKEKYQSLSLLQNGSPSKGLSQVLEKNILTYTNDLRKVARDKYREGTTREALGEWEKAKVYYARDYVNESDPVRKEAIKNNMQLEVNELVSRQIMWPKDGEKQIEHFDQLVEKTNTKMAFNEIMKNPELVDNIIDQRNIPLEYQADLRKQARIEVDRRWSETEHKRVEEQRITDDMFFKKLKMPEKYGPLTIPEVTESNLNLGEKKYYTGVLENQSKPGKMKTDPLFAVNILDNILSGKLKDVREKILYEMSGDPDSDNPPKLNLQQGETLLRNYWTKVHEKPEVPHYTSDPWFQLTRQEISQFFGHVEETPEEGLKRKFAGSPAIKKDYDNHFEALSALMRSVEKNNLKGEDIWKKGQELLKVYSARKAQKGTSESVGKPDKYGLTVGEKKSKGNDIYEYIGNNQWKPNKGL